MPQRELHARKPLQDINPNLMQVKNKNNNQTNVPTTAFDRMSKWNSEELQAKQDFQEPFPIERKNSHTIKKQPFQPTLEVIEEGIIDSRATSIYMLERICHLLIQGINPSTIQPVSNGPSVQQPGRTNMKATHQCFSNMSELSPMDNDLPPEKHTSQHPHIL